MDMGTSDRGHTGSKNLNFENGLVEFFRNLNFKFKLALLGGIGSCECGSMRPI